MGDGDRETKILQDREVNKRGKDRQRGRLGGRERGRERPETQRERQKEKTGERERDRQTEACPCDSADLTGLGFSAAVPPAFVLIAGENSIPV